MKKWRFLLLLLICLGVSLVYTATRLQDNADVELQYGNQPNVSSEEQSDESTRQVDVTEDQTKQGNLLLINRDYAVKRDSIRQGIVDLSTHRDLTQGYVLLDNNISLPKDIARKFSDMVTAAGKEGVNHFSMTSGVRSFEKQRELYQEKGANLALPAGHSEHNAGLALDVGSTQESMYNAPEAKWIEENAWKHGFILRYPEGKVDVTGIEYEPWHIRYVGLPHSAIMKEKNFVLEEYLNHLKQKKKMSVDVDGKAYTVSYHSFSENMTIDIPEHLEYKISGNNMNGVIVTVFE
ncbi:M15 family metallopeptidase [Salibacterium halotolerans]|uniref:D-alanyl-D-alanine carboxypeptidase n=1 Tax=Salibacterium halotolerans TaxID=1884432 RepID=A0A1I5P9X8_9BACI|nr:M15 family metallopeptidase [Salibacterium halotolerans]SFP30783.1 D-alanyl-D-alanine carboxypeptidase [Salibacterium halotolerans]